MTELPQPPNQPPNQPSTPSGYGHLPGPPQQGYGFPPQGENPYAQQPAHPPQPPTVPQQWPAGPGGPGSGSGPASPKKNRLIVLVAAAVAAALVLGGVGYVALSGGDEDPEPVAQQPADAKPSGSPSVDKGDGNGDGGGPQMDLNAGRKQGEDKVLWLKTTKIDGPGMGVDAAGQWVIGDTVVKTLWKNLTGYSVTDGKEKWTLSFPAQICSVAPQTTAEGRTVVMYRDGEGENTSCTQLRVVDLKTGKEVWSKEVPKEGFFDIFTSPALSMIGDTVTVSRGGNASAFKISNGDKLFASPVGDGCNPDSYEAGNGKMIALATCSDEDSTAEVHGIDPVTGAKGWAYRLPAKFKVTSIYSVNPTVIDIGNEQTKQRSIVVLGPDGKQTATLAGEGSFAVGCGDTGLFRSLATCPSAVVDGNTLYLPTAAGTGKANEIVAFDLTTGKDKWRVPAGGTRTLTPLKAVNGQLVAYRKAEEDQGGEVLSIPAAGGTPTALLRHPSGAAAPIERTFPLPKLDYVDGRFIISSTHLRAQGQDEKLLMVFGK
ncbi:PQQ-binding-like beta-propeller repeat protein [Streptomyces sp. NBC_01214]|uniref:outer membrane protein assembly factor BamB family protein n=1 Tax=Streptomyces sp. NBC_01214 TaxID=2903777 RepID=UPI0022534371|nr:PQQ-binding-like beta-propeller repeat protein [Streptomyces sp. NBC_01214]MCX4801083.1 PQQ-binding-like beta-propeller repeat protein [Streptomyces sp. NBC_01214]